MCAKKNEKEQEEFDMEHIGFLSMQKRKEMQIMESNLQEDITPQDQINFLKYKCSILTEEIERWREECRSLELTILYCDDC